MQIPIYQIDAFSGSLFSGNPAAVCPLEAWLDEGLMQDIARENNLSETAFFVPDGEAYHIRWFTPVAEVDLCGHATLASAFVLLEYLAPSKDEVTFHSRSGDLTVKKDRDLLAMSFPSRAPGPCKTPPALIKALGKEPLKVLASEDYFVVFSKEREILDLEPDMSGLKKVDLRGVVVTAPGHDVDFVSRFFAPKLGVDEDPVTGSAHCALTPYWSHRLKKKDLHARQISRRGGEIFCRDLGNRVVIAGRAVRYMKGVITL